MNDKEADAMLRSAARGQVCAPHLPEIGMNLFNFAFEHSLSDMKEWTDNKVVLLGNIPPRDVLARGTVADVRAAVRASLDPVNDRRRVIMSCGVVNAAGCFVRKDPGIL